MIDATTAPAIESEALRERYRIERHRRLPQSAGDRQSREVSDCFGHLVVNLYGGAPDRDALDDEVNALVVGRGLAGGGGCARRGSNASASSSPAATLAAPGTGIDIQGPHATSNRIFTCRSSRKPATCRSSGTQRRATSVSIAGGLPDISTSTRVHCSLRRWQRSTGGASEAHWVANTNRGYRMRA